MIDIPADIWRYVAQFIHQDDLCAMLSVNSTFFQLAMDARYRVARLNRLGDDLFVKESRRLRDPAISHRILRLEVNPWFLNLQQTDPRDPERPSPAFLQEIVQDMVDTVTCLRNVTEFSICCRTREITAEDLLPFLTAAWKTFGAGLRKFYFDVWWEHLPVLLSNADGLTMLRDLEVAYDCYDAKLKAPVQSGDTTPTAALAAFINKVAPTLQILSLPSFHINELSLFFHRLEDIPSLKSFDFTIDANMHSLREPLGPTRFLRNHTRTLRHVKWSMRLALDDVFPDNRDIMQWLEKNEADKFFLSDLLSLRIALPASYTSVDLLGRYIKRSAETLTSLELWGPKFSYDEVHALTSSLATPRRSYFSELHIQVKLLSPELIMLLASTFPRLGMLHIVASNVSGSQETSSSTLEQGAQQFEDSIRNCNIHDWQLHDVTIIVGGSMIGGELAEVLAECCPSIIFEYPRNFF